MAAVKAMVDALAALPGPAAPPAPPASSGAPFVPTCRTASNYAHTVEGRAHVGLGLALANGSNDNMGWWNIFVTTTLKETAPGRWVVGTCP